MIICNLLFILHAIKLIMIYYNNNNLKIYYKNINKFNDIIFILK